MITDKVLAGEMFWVKRMQQQAVNSEKFVEDKRQLNLQLNAVGMCCGRIQGKYLLYLPVSSLFTTKLVRLFMAKIREM